MQGKLVCAGASGLFVAACASAPPEAAKRCDEVFVAAPPSGVMSVDTALSAARARFYPELEAAPIRLIEKDLGPAVMFTANLDLTTLERPPLERDYEIWLNPKLLEEPPSGRAVGAILTHELKHILDYSKKDAQTLAAFALWYAISDVSEYERQTDEYALDLGCALGLSEYRSWLYEQIPADAVEQKKREYYTPAEIEAYVDQSGTR
ncbi:MAG: hypothetical protein HY791_33705 [Deltaproteobacteria bacterium]|nr:hypothetical protein [Deltaproteobacteria bacterium]